MSVAGYDQSVTSGVFLGISSKFPYIFSELWSWIQQTVIVVDIEKALLILFVSRVFRRLLRLLLLLRFSL